MSDNNSEGKNTDEFVADQQRGSDVDKGPQQQQQVVVANTYTTNVDPNNPLPLDWTKLNVSNENDFPVRYPNDVAEWSPDDTEIVIVGTSGQKITVIGKTFLDASKTNLSELRTLVLRSHMIHDMAGLEQLSKLETLELYDNIVQSLNEKSLKGCGSKTLRILDMSYNAIRDMTPVQYCNGDTLTELYLASNKLKSIDGGLKHLSNLRKLDLGSNKIRKLNAEEFSGLRSLEELWIGKNKIDSLDGIQCLTKLKRLDVQSNRLTSLIDENTGLCYLNPLRDTLEGEIWFLGKASDHNSLLLVFSIVLYSFRFIW